MNGLRLKDAQVMLQRVSKPHCVWFLIALLVLCYAINSQMPVENVMANYLTSQTSFIGTPRTFSPATTQGGRRALRDASSVASKECYRHYYVKH